MAGASGVSPLVCALQRGARAWRMGHRPPLCRRHFNRPHLQYSTCCRQRGSPGAHTPPEGMGREDGAGAGGLRRHLTRGEALEGRLCGLGSARPRGKWCPHQSGCPEPGRPVSPGEVGETCPWQQAVAGHGGDPWRHQDFVQQSSSWGTLLARCLATKTSLCSLTGMQMHTCPGSSDTGAAPAPARGAASRAAEARQPPAAPAAAVRL